MRKSNREKRSWYPAFSLMEILVAVTVFMVMVGSVSIFSIDAVAFVKNEQRSVDANTTLSQLLNGVVDYKDKNWNQFVSHTDDGSKYFANVDGVFQIVDGEEQIGNIRRYFSVESVYRDNEGNIVDEGGSLDHFARKVTVTVEWVDIWDEDRTESIITYVNKWDVQRWRSEDEDDFDNGEYWQSEYGEDGVGLELNVGLIPNWCNPVLSTSYHDIPGQGLPSTIITDQNYGYVGTGGNASGIAFTKLEVVGPPHDQQVVVVGEWDGDKVNHIYVEGDYAYLSTDSNQQELMILDHTQLPYTIIGSVNVPGSADGTASLKHGNLGLVATGRSLSTFDATDPFGDRTTLDSIVVGSSAARINEIVAHGNYAYVSVRSDENEVYIVDISNPSNISTVNSLNLNDENGVTVYITEDGKRLFVMTTQRLGGPEFYIVDVENPTGELEVINTLDIDTMNANAIAVNEADKVIAIGGNSINGGNNYRVFTYLTHEDITDCGGIHVSGEVRDMDEMKLWEDTLNDYAYYTLIVTHNRFEEMRIIRGDEGEEGGPGYGYFLEGTFESNIFDTKNDSIDYHYFTWEEELPEGTDITIQVRAASSVEEIEDAQYIGPDGTENTSFTDPEFAEIPDSLDGLRYIQFKAFLSTTNADVTPLLKKIDIYFE